MKKIIIVLAVILVLTFVLASCNSGKDPSASSEASASNTIPLIPLGSEVNPGPFVGGYTLDTAVAGDIPEDQFKIFAEATGLAKSYVDKDKLYNPLACLGTRVIAGSVNAFMCIDYSNTENKKLVVAFITKMAGEDATVTSIVDFDIADYTENVSAPTENEDYGGGWTAITEGVGMSTMPQTLATAASKVFSELDGSSFVPLACLGTQTVDGTNYALLCNVTPSTLNGRTNVYLVQIHVPVSGDPSILTTAWIDINAIENSAN